MKKEDQLDFILKMDYKLDPENHLSGQELFEKFTP